MHLVCTRCSFFFVLFHSFFVEGSLLNPTYPWVRFFPRPLSKLFLSRPAPEASVFLGRATSFGILPQASWLPSSSFLALPFLGPPLHLSLSIWTLWLPLGFILHWFRLYSPRAILFKNVVDFNLTFDFYMALTLMWQNNDFALTITWLKSDASMIWTSMNCLWVSYVIRCTFTWL